jgi:succinate dehydrogenase / fumarate reductase cytochrome b subunit
LYVLVYVVSMLILAFHLWHGFGSAFQTLGLNHLKYNPVINTVGRAFAIIVPALFALIPIWMFLK